MKVFLSRLILVLSICSFSAYSQSLDASFDKFDAMYQSELGSTRGCEKPEHNVFKVCSDSLKNDGNAPYILHHGKVTDKVMVLFHGLSDSPFYFRSIAQDIYQQGFNVIVALLPGHGKKQADQDMQDYALADRWRVHVADVIDYAADLGRKRYIGGFSTGGALAVEYILQHPKSVKGLALFSGALALESSAESMANMWGAHWLAKILDGEYVTQGLNPYKYPSVALFSAVELTEVIFSVRDLLEHGASFDIPLFVAHSMADTTTPIIGVKNLIAVNKGPSDLFEIAKALEVCHADLVLDQEQVVDIHYDTSKIDDIRPCSVPKANPKHADMLLALNKFLATH